MFAPEPGSVCINSCNHTVLLQIAGDWCCFNGVCVDVKIRDLW